MPQKQLLILDERLTVSQRGTKQRSSVSCQECATSCFWRSNVVCIKIIKKKKKTCQDSSLAVMLKLCINLNNDIWFTDQFSVVINDD